MQIIKHSQRNTAFSLVELSIVLVILGLLVGGILAGQSLIRASELRSVTTEHGRYTTAVHAFRDKYFSIPGDMSNATSFWGIAAGTLGNDVTCQNFVSTSAATCNGNADGTINLPSNEMYRFWQHLSNAGLIEGQYTGTANGGAYIHTPGTNAPLGKLSSASTWSTATNATATSGSSSTYDGLIGSYFLYGGKRAGMPELAVLKGEELWNIDTKTDDGKPAFGKLQARSSSGWNDAGGTLDRCTTSASSTDTAKDYDLDAPSINCAIFFRNPF